MSHHTKSEKHHGHHHHHPEERGECRDQDMEHGDEADGCCDSAAEKSHRRGGCCGGPRVVRHFISPREYKEQLEKYITDLKNELAGAEAALEKL